MSAVVEFDVCGRPPDIEIARFLLLVAFGATGWKMNRSTFSPPLGTGTRPAGCRRR